MNKNRVSFLSWPHFPLGRDKDKGEERSDIQLVVTCLGKSYGVIGYISPFPKKNVPPNVQLREVYPIYKKNWNIIVQEKRNRLISITLEKSNSYTVADK
jgi:hypothetical protein